MKEVGLFIQNQILGMQWLSELVGYLLEMLGLSVKEGIGAILHFFLYDTIKIFILLAILIYVISYIQSYFPPEKSKKILGKFKGMGANIIGALLGTITPFCSCSSIPIFMGFTSAGLPLGVTFSFLISSPMVDLGSLVLLMSIFGWKIAVAYVIVGLIIAILGGTLIEKLHLDDEVADFVKDAQNVSVSIATLSHSQRHQYAKLQLLQTVKKVAPYIFIGVAIGSLIHNVIPSYWVTSLLGGKQFYSVPLATIVGIPMYADIFGTIPVAESLLLKGAGLGTVIAFMMAVTTLSLPSLVMLKKVVKNKLLFIFIGIVVCGIMLVGVLFNMYSYLIM